MSLHHGVPRGTILRPLKPILKLLEQMLNETCKMIQCADDTVLFCDENDIKNALKLLQESCQKLPLYFPKQSFKINTKKTVLIKLSEKHTGENHNTIFSTMLDNYKIEKKP